MLKQLGLALILVLSASAQTFSEFTPPTAGTGPTTIVAGPDGRLWFTEAGVNAIGPRIAAQKWQDVFPTITTGYAFPWEDIKLKE